eukprot:m.224794 g.224794  ORF g.224794 m.224794 type:complete len:650 (-) comp33443_c0_seq2:300-2249(-)
MKPVVTRLRFVKVCCVLVFVVFLSQVPLPVWHETNTQFELGIEQNVVMPPLAQFDCNDVASTQKRHAIAPNGYGLLDFAVAPDGAGVLLGGWPNTPIIGEQERAPVLTFVGQASKRLNGPILSTGSALLFNCDVEYRVVWMKVWLNHTGLQGEEAVESDICLNIFNQSKTTSTSSGEELFCTHEHFFNGDERNKDRGGPVEYQFPGGGFPLRSGHRLDVSSVSKVFNRQEWNPMSQEVLQERLTPDFLALRFEVKMVRADLIKRRALKSVRAPLRDRSLFVLPQREFTPSTPFRNIASTNISILGIGLFQSMLEHYTTGDSMLQVFVDDKLVHRRCLPSHRPHVASSYLLGLIPTNIVLTPNNSIRITHSLRQDTSNTYNAPVYDFAAYVFYEANEHTDEALSPHAEIDLGQSKLDLNGDAYPDHIDYDIDGHIWSEMTQGAGVHDTQHATIYDFITRDGRYNRPTTVWRWSRAIDSVLMSVTLTDATTGLCCRLRAVSLSHHVFEYCDTSKLAPSHLLDANIHGDFDGDGHMDRIRLRPHIETTNNSLLSGSDGVTRDHVSVQHNTDAREYMYRIFLARGTGFSFLRETEIARISACEAAMQSAAVLMPLFKPSVGRHVLAYNIPRCSSLWMWREHLDVNAHLKQIVD